MNDDKRREQLRGQTKRLRRGPIRKSRGTPGLPLSDSKAICGYCLNTGVMELHEGGSRRCKCGQAVLR